MSNSTNLTYTGIVTISYLMDGKTVRNIHHNAGTDNLFKLIARALVGENIYQDRPVKFDVQVKNGSVWESMVLTGGVITSLSYMKDTDNNWVNKLTATISRQMLNSEFEVGREYRFTLSSNSDVVYATLSVPSEDLVQVTGSMQALVDWTLKITNAN